jgi:hypothetical protein
MRFTGWLVTAMHSRLVTGVALTVLQSIVGCNYKTANSAFQDILMYEVMQVAASLLHHITASLHHCICTHSTHPSSQNPVNCAPTAWNDATATNADKDRMYQAIYDNMDDGPQRMADALQTPGGRRVSGSGCNGT